jgi:hypothetical protein
MSPSPPIRGQLRNIIRILKIHRQKQTNADERQGHNIKSDEQTAKNETHSNQTIEHPPSNQTLYEPYLRSDIQGLLPKPLQAFIPVSLRIEILMALSVDAKFEFVKPLTSNFSNQRHFS